MASTKFLISFCNVFPRGFALGVFDYDNEKFDWIDLHEIHEEISGIVGMLFKNDNYWILSQIPDDKVAGLSVLDTSFKILKTFWLNTTDAHDLTFYNNSFLITDTIKNKIIKISLNDHGGLSIVDFWKYNNDEKDTVHINSIASSEELFFISLFGQKPKEGWTSTREGKIIELPSNTLLSDNLHHPHSLSIIDNDLYCLESGTSLVHRFHNDDHKIILKLDGYLRGMTFDEENFYITASGYRQKSRSTGTLNLPNTSDSHNPHSFIYKINRKSLQYEKKDLSVFGNEIFDLIALNHNYEFTSNENPVLQRIQAYANFSYKKS